jgi:hypothetical protein
MPLNGCQKEGKPGNNIDNNGFATSSVTLPACREKQDLEKSALLLIIDSVSK